MRAWPGPVRDGGAGGAARVKGGWADGLEFGAGSRGCDAAAIVIRCVSMLRLNAGVPAMARTCALRSACAQH